MEDAKEGADAAAAVSSSEPPRQGELARSTAVVSPLGIADSKQEDATSFLSRHGLGALSKAFASAGFQSAADVLSLTPRKYQVVGVTQVGTQLRLARVIDETRRINEDRAAGLALRLVSAKVRVGEAEVEFRLPPTSTVDDLHAAVSRHIGLPEEAFSLCQGGGE